MQRSQSLKTAEGDISSKNVIGKEAEAAMAMPDLELTYNSLFRLPTIVEFSVLKNYISTVKLGFNPIRTGGGAESAPPWY